MGFFRHGISVMALFFLTITVSAFINIGPLLFLLPIIWFYSFFHVHNLKNMPDEEFYALEDDFVLPLKGTSYDDINIDLLIKKYKKPLAIILIIIGATILWRNLINFLDYILPSNFVTGFLWQFSYQIPQVIIGILILLLGLYLIAGKKKELEDKREDDPSYGRDFGFHKDAPFFQEPPAFPHPQEPHDGRNPHRPEGPRPEGPWGPQDPRPEGPRGPQDPRPEGPWGPQGPRPEEPWVPQGAEVKGRQPEAPFAPENHNPEAPRPEGPVAPAAPESHSREEELR
ncbi:MAG: hypothetical protein ACOYBE_04900 [Blautia sp.]